jgi:uncharacterized protein YndB with AHSA1/START domain
MPELMKSKTVSVSIAQPPQRVYDFAVEPENLPRWAPALCRSVAYESGEWLIQTPDGHATVRFAARNPFGVLDHDVRLSSGQEIHSVMRVVPNGEGSEICFTLFQRPGMTDDQYAEDARLVESDLRNLKQVLEAS